MYHRKIGVGVGLDEKERKESVGVDGVVKSVKSFLPPSYLGSLPRVHRP